MATLPVCGLPLILPPRFVAVGTPRWQGLCSHFVATLVPVLPSCIAPRIVVAAPSGDHPTSPTGCLNAEPILADVCKALSDSQISFRPPMSEVEALLGNDWWEALHA